jgi:hypothetical protein
VASGFAAERAFKVVKLTEETDIHIEVQTCVGPIVSPDAKPAMALAVRMIP